MADDKNNTEKRVAIVFAGVILVFAVIAIITVFALHNNADRKLFIGIITVFVGIISLFASMAMYTSPMVAVKRKRETPSTPAPIVDNTTASAASTSAADSVREYEVFLSFRGADTRKNFTDYLYHDLISAGVHTFRDDNELSVGEEIGAELLSAIKQSKISIPIFSKNYAFSKWCLRELAHMVECRANGGQLIYPIFYDVEPNDLQHCEKGSYKDAFLKHKKDKKLDEKTVQEWKAALEIVGDLKGLELKKVTNGHEGEFVKKFVEEVLSKLKKNYQHVPKYLVGINSHIEEMERLLNHDSNSLRIIGILGMGGLGKTTIAKVIYNILSERFECRCFLGDVREKSEQRNGIVDLQTQLLSGFLKRGCSKIDDEYAGLNKIQDVVHGKKVLLVLDDVDKMSQIEKLVGNHNWYDARSKFIITTRNKEVLEELELNCQKEGLHEVYTSYEPKFMNRDYSLELFSKYAFKEDSPPKGYDALAMEVVSYAGGLPLVLVTLGSLLLIEKDRVSWEDKLKKLKAIPPGEVLGRLRISFDALDNAQQQIFLDIACFFSGDDKTKPYYMWDDCKFYPGEGINTLVRRSLITVGDDNRLWMHDRLRELGEQIICEKYQDEPEKWSRLWRYKDGQDVLEKQLGTKNVKLLRLDRRYARRRLRGEDLRKLPNLRYLSMYGIELDGDFKNLLQNLRWLQWWLCPGNCAPTNFNLKNLVVLELWDNCIRDDWWGWSQIKMSNKLKVLKLSGCENITRIPHLSAFPTLERLELGGCNSLRRLDGLDELESLKYLRASRCFSLKSLPDLSKLTRLQTLDVKYCKKLTKIQGLDKLASLEILETSNCTALERLPNLSNLQKLTRFDSSGCQKLVEIQDDWEGWSQIKMSNKLKVLNLKGCYLLTRIPHLSAFPTLERLELLACQKLCRLDGLEKLESLKYLDASHCPALKSLPDLSKLTSLQTLYVQHCWELTEIQGLDKLVSLEILDMTSCTALERLPNLSNLQKLTRFNSPYCKKLVEIQDDWEGWSQIKRKRETPSTPAPIVDNTTASASTSAADLVGEYEVFLSFRGADTRNSFTDYLYLDLIGAGVRTFSDDNELPVGEEIGAELLSAIKQSKISIPIFSKNYAFSKWCLRELAHMVECRANGGQLIYPIFYDVEPNDVQHCEKGSYKDAFLKHENDKELDEKTVQQWKVALEIVGDLKGLELKKVTNWRQGEFVKIIVDKVLSKLKKNYKHVPENLVGMDGHIKEMERLINIDFDGVRIIGILGMGGLGKTTIAMVIYNQVCELFECHCFIGDVRENSNSVGIVKLQERLVSQILKRDSKFDDVHQGLNEIKCAVHRKKVIIVLDDVDKKFQIDKLVGNHSWYGAGSRIIITTRDEDALLPLEITCQKKALHEIYRCYRPNLMGGNLALKLFSKHAFMADSPPEGYDALAMDVVSYAGGLPLVLVTLGSLLFFETDKYLWQEKLKKLQALPPLEVLGRLRISYDALDNAQQQIFLDIACFFSGEDKTNPYYMWDKCGFYPGEGINALVRRSLITVGDDNKLWMHDRLRELGEQIICEKYQDEPEKWSRLWRPKDAFDVLGKHLGTKNVKLLRLYRRGYDRRYDRGRFRGEDFRKLPNLRYLSFRQIDLDGDFKNLLQNLRWLQWRYCPGNCAPTNLHLKNLVVLDLSDSDMRDDWGGWSQIKMSNKLKVLNLSSCRYLTRIPHLSAFPTLERLELSECSKLCRLDGLEELESLKYLNASHCSRLESLPDLSKLTSLQTLNLKYRSQLTEIQGLSKLTSLQTLNLKYCFKLTEIQGLSKLTSLQTLDVNSCFDLTEIQGLDKLASLEFLDTSWCRALERLPNLSNLQKLTRFDLSWCEKLVEIQGLDRLASLEQLDIEGCKSLESLPDLSNLTNLKELNVSHCVKLTELRGLEELKFLKQLRIVGCMSLENLPNLPNTMIQITEGF